ncbi:MAG: hypothetical protein RIR86_307, partial [Acidobacteriota bacterium]
MGKGAKSSGITTRDQGVDQARSTFGDDGG